MGRAEPEDQLYGRPAGPWRSERWVSHQFVAIRMELTARKGQTLQRVWLDYREQPADGYRHSRFCGLWQHWKERRDSVKLRVHKAGETLFVNCVRP